MSTKTKRMDRLEARLGPKDLVLLHLEECRRFRSILEHVEFLAGNPPTRTLCLQIEEAVSQAHRHDEPAARNRAIREAQRDGLFLALLLSQVQQSVAAAARTDALSILLLRTLFENAALHADAGDAEAETAALDRASTMASALVAELSTVEGAVGLVSTTYFSDRDILYPEDGERLPVLRAFLNDHLEAARAVWAERWRVSVSDAREPDARGRVRRRAESWVRLAKAQTCERMGEEGRARAFLSALVTRPTKRPGRCLTIPCAGDVAPARLPAQDQSPPIVNEVPRSCTIRLAKSSRC